jgi:diguanylate cyclase (GGDEF)-like protein
MSAAKASAAVLQRFLALQQAAMALNDNQRLAMYCRRALQYVPGVADAWVCLDCRVYPHDERIKTTCDVACPPRTGSLAVDTSDIERRLGLLIFPIMGPASLYGAFVVKPRDDGAIEPYKPIIMGFASFVGCVLAQREASRRLVEENITLKSDRGDLQQLVQERDRELEFSLTHDQLTGLPNRLTLDDRIGQAMSYSRRYGLKVAVAYINLDSFKYIHNSYGSIVSDGVLRTVGKRLRAICQPNDTVARISADHFGMVVTSLGDAGDLSTTLSRVLADIKRPIAVGTKEIVITSTVGCSVFPGDGDNAETLLQRASIASHKGREIRRDRMYFFAAGDEGSVNDRAELESDLRRAVSLSQLVLHYQPKVSLSQERYVGVEALVRWMHPSRGLVSPAVFIPIAEESGTIFEVGEWALTEACNQAARWHQDGQTGISMAVNLSARQLRDPEIVHMVRRVLGASGLPPELLELEITESSIMQGVEHVLPLLNQLKSLGVSLAIDDFGTGYSNLNYLRRFPVDRLKIDQTLIQEVDTVVSAGAVARGVIGLGHTLGLKVVAEGVETIEQARFLRLAECDEIQGYLFARPLPAEEARRVLKSGPGIDWYSLGTGAGVAQRVATQS